MVSKGDCICIKTLLYFFYFVELYIWANILRPSHFLLKTKGLSYGFNKVFNNAFIPVCLQPRNLVKSG